jgi:hypothetical protein
VLYTPCRICEEPCNIYPWRTCEKHCCVLYTRVGNVGALLYISITQKICEKPSYIYLCRICEEPCYIYPWRICEEPCCFPLLASTASEMVGGRGESGAICGGQPPPPLPVSMRSPDTEPAVHSPSLFFSLSATASLLQPLSYSLSVAASLLHHLSHITVRIRPLNCCLF